ncbi:MAG TPA: hypothetical protein VFJ58_16190 [Armatimonadota bacterium]|nr:hypothetical protein [Armatimonadota bacterium]
MPIVVTRLDPHSPDAGPPGTANGRSNSYHHTYVSNGATYCCYIGQQWAMSLSPFPVSTTTRKGNIVKRC